MTSNIETTKDYLLNAPLPNHGDTYTLISHKHVIDNTKMMLSNSGFVVTKELYRANADARVAQGIYFIKHLSQESEDSDLGMMFAWTNSYDKSIRFQCSVGAHVMVCSNGMLCGDINYARKHTGTADQEIRMQISSQIKNAQKVFDKIVSDKNSLKTTILTKKSQGELLGRMYLNENLISPRQMSCVKKEIENPSFDYGVDQENAWAFYNHVTHAYKNVHPRSWLSDTKKFHEFMTHNVLNSMGIQHTDTVDADEIEVEDLIDYDWTKIKTL